MDENNLESVTSLSSDLSTRENIIFKLEDKEVTVSHLFSFMNITLIKVTTLLYEI